MDYAALGKRVRQYRRIARMTQETLSERIGISCSFLGHIERGTRKASLETLIALSNALEVSPDLLLQDSLSTALLSSRQSMAAEHLAIRELQRILSDPDGNLYFKDE